MKTNYLLSIVGPTAIGKTALSIRLAQHFNTEIISADSRQFYKEMHIGTATPTLAELESAPHHFIQHISIEDDYNVGTFEKDAIALLKQLHQNHQVVIMVGGSGLFVNAVINGLDEFPKIDPIVREELNTRLEKDGLESLQFQLKKLDSKAFASIAIDNPHRVIRALEVCIGSHRAYSSFLGANKTTRDFKTISIGLTAERSTIYDRINQRVDHMITEGLLDEVKTLRSKQHLNALNTVGYKELFKYLDNEWTLDMAISEIKKNTRRFAKRQMTWFKKNKEILWFDYNTDVQNIIETIERQIIQIE